MPLTSENVIRQISKAFRIEDSEILSKTLTNGFFDKFVDTSFFDSPSESTEKMAQLAVTGRGNVENAREKAKSEADEVIKKLKLFAEAFDELKEALTIAEEMDSKLQDKIRNRIDEAISALDDYLNSLEPEIRAIVYSLAEIDTIAVEAPTTVTQVIKEFANGSSDLIAAGAIQRPDRVEPEQTRLNPVQRELLSALTTGITSDRRNRLRLALTEPQKRILQSFLDSDALPANHLTNGEIVNISGVDSGNVGRTMLSLIAKLKRLGLENFIVLSDQKVRDGNREVSHWIFSMNDSIPESVTVNVKHMIETQQTEHSTQEAFDDNSIELTVDSIHRQTLQSVIETLSDGRFTAIRTILTLFLDGKLHLNQPFSSVDIANAMSIPKYNNCKRNLGVLKNALDSLPAPLSRVLVLIDNEQDASLASSPKQYMLVTQPSAETPAEAKPVVAESATNTNIYDAFTDLLETLDLNDDEKATLQLTEEVVIMNPDIELYLTFFILVRAKAIIPSTRNFEDNISSWVVKQSEGNEQLLQLMNDYQIKIVRSKINFRKLGESLQDLLSRKGTPLQITSSGLGVSLCYPPYLSQRVKALGQVAIGKTTVVTPENHLAVDAAFIEAGS